MECLLLSLWNRSAAAGWLILAVVLLRLVLQKAPKSMRCLLWALVAVRLVCPFSIESMLSLIPSAETVPQAVLAQGTFQVSSGAAALNKAVSEQLVDFYGAAAGPDGHTRSAVFICGAVWLAGLAALCLWALVSWLRLRRRVAAAVPEGDNVWLCDGIASPFLLGLFRPRIYLPAGLDAESRAYVLAHERAHLRRRDHWIKPLGFLLLAVYWFHPLIWLAYVLLCRDIELACDEAVIRELGARSKKPYSQALLRCSVRGSAIAACPLAFGEVGVKERVKNVLNYKKPAFWVVLVSLALCAAAAVCFLTDPKTEKPLPAPEGDFFTISSPLLSSIPPRWEDPDTVAAMAELLDGLTYQPAAEESAESQTMALSLDLVVQGENRRLLVCPNGVGTLDGAEGWVSFDDTGLYALLRSYYSQATGVTAYTGGQLLYELASLNYLPPDGSHYARVLEEGPFLTILDGEGETVFAGELDRTRTYSRTEFLRLFDSYAQAGGLEQMVPTEVTEVAERFYRKDSQDESGMAVWELSLEGGGTWLWLSEGTPPLRLYELIDLDQAFPFLMPGSGGSFGGYLWTCNPGYGLPIRFAGEFDHVTLYAREDTLRGTDGTPTDSLALAPGEVVRWDPGAVGVPPESAVLHYYIHQPDGTILEDYLELRTVSKVQGLYGSRTYGAAIDWLGLASSKLHQVRLTADGDSLVLSSGPSIYLGTATLQGERTDPIGTEDAPAEG
ncbi:MAG: M56 family metallopeptidase [Oscillospiraceae bacterium]|nr:M56 family metallopeptidase [Oscillospiraceae bacterium]